MTDADLRRRLLKLFYDMRHKNGGWVPTSDMNLSGEESVDQQTIGSICGQLGDAGLLHWKPLLGGHEGFVIGMGKITGLGVDVYEGTRSSPITITPEPSPTMSAAKSDGKPAVSIQHSGQTEYDIALSFAGEDREYVEQVATSLRSRNVKVFYDNFEEAKIWGKDLYTYLIDIYQNKARFTVIFASTSYEEKLWTKHERQAAQSRAFKEAREYILPARFDDTEIPGILQTTGYISLANRTPEQLADLIVQKLQGDGIAPVPVSTSSATLSRSKLEIEVGEAGGFFETGRAGSLYTHSRTLKLRISNTDPHHALSGCKVQISSITPHEQDGPWILKEGFSLAAGDHEFIPLAKYIEPNDIKKSPYGDTFFEILTLKNRPLPPSSASHELTIRATAMESAFVEMKCKLWIDETGRLRIEAIRP